MKLEIDNMQSLFVYGTLRLGEPNAHVMERIGGTWCQGYILGQLENSGWGAALGSPGIRLKDDGSVVHGYVFISEHLEDHWAYLDEFEGAEYHRQAVTVYLQDGKVMQSQVYALI